MRMRNPKNLGGREKNREGQGLDAVETGGDGNRGTGQSLMGRVGGPARCVVVSAATIGGTNSMIWILLCLKKK